MDKHCKKPLDKENRKAIELLQGTTGVAWGWQQESIRRTRGRSNNHTNPLHISKKGVKLHRMWQVQPQLDKRQDFR